MQFWDGHLDFEIIFCNTHCLSASPICEFLANCEAVCVSKILRFQSPNIVVQLILTASLILITLHLFVLNLQFLQIALSSAFRPLLISSTCPQFAKKAEVRFCPAGSQLARPSPTNSSSDPHQDCHSHQCTVKY